jgi:hypothetical protein
VVAARTLPAQERQAEVDPGTGMVLQTAQRVAVGGLRAPVLSAHQREVADEDVRVGLLGCVAHGPGRLGPRFAPASRHPAQGRAQAQSRGPGPGRQPYGLLRGGHGLGVAAESFEREAGEAIAPVGAGIKVHRLSCGVQCGLRLIMAEQGDGRDTPFLPAFRRRREWDPCEVLFVRTSHHGGSRASRRLTTI